MDNFKYRTDFETIEYSVCMYVQSSCMHATLDDLQSIDRRWSLGPTMVACDPIIPVQALDQPVGRYKAGE